MICYICKKDMDVVTLNTLDTKGKKVARCFHCGRMELLTEKATELKTEKVKKETELLTGRKNGRKK